MTEDKGTETVVEETPQAKTVTVDEAEFAQLQVAKKFHSEVLERAEDMDLDDAQEYLDTLESVVQAQVAEKPAEKTVEPKKEPEKQPAAVVDPQVAQAHNTSVQAILSANWTGFQMTELQKPEGDRLAVEKKQLDKMIHTRPAMVTEAAKDFDGNLYAGAAHILSFKQSKTQVKEATEAAIAAKAKAAGQATIPDGGKTAEPEVQSAQQKAQAEHKTRQDSIYPDG